MKNTFRPLSPFLVQAGSGTRQSIPDPFKSKWPSKYSPHKAYFRKNVFPLSVKLDTDISAKPLHLKNPSRLNNINIQRPF